MKNIINVTIEIQKGSRIKYEYNRKTKQIEVDRILRGDFVYPANYGFIPQALDWDGDELDVLVYSPETFAVGSSLKARIIGAMKMIDDGETDTKLIAVHADDYRLENIEKLSDLPVPFLDTVKTFFSTYKNWKRPGITSVDGFEDVEWALAEYQECVELMEQYGSMDKKEFIKLMQEKHPEKYTK
ncbi:inorganic diphosphatase [Mycoplasmopsis sturni]|uniref:inorganic diphosphatase n=1 Tax=Mycoplasmopsis sturni TaxID=39047 RepID=UPI000565F01B|nr:inorganic diphosphatase [Mycoplasmopsis sturni]